MLITSTSVLSHSISAPGPSRVSPPVSPPPERHTAGTDDAAQHAVAPESPTYQHGLCVRVLCVCV